jgi:hypothetical protein
VAPSLTRTQKIGLGIASVWPIVYLIVMLTVTKLVDLKSIVGPAPPLDGLPGWFVIVLGVHGATIILGGAVTLFYIWYVFKGGRVPRERKLPWVIALLVCNIIAIVPFFWRYIWLEKREGQG